MKTVRTFVARFATLLLTFSLVACSNGGDDDNEPPVPTPDSTPPGVSDVGASGGTSLNRTATLTVTATDNVGVTEVRFFVDGVLIGSATTAPYTVDWDTSAETDGDHVLSAEAEDAAGNVSQSGEVTVTVRNVAEFAVSLDGSQENPPTDSAAEGQTDFTVNLVTGEVSGTLNVTGLTPTAAHIHDAFAGLNGGVLIPLDQDAGNPGDFTVPAGATLDEAGVDRLLAGALYVNAHSDAAPGGEIRGQILPDGFELYFTALDSSTTVPHIESRATGRAAVTVDTATGTLVVQATTSGIDDATDAHVHDGYAGSNGPVLVPLAQDGTDPAHWFVEDGSLNATGIDLLAAGSLYINIHSPAHPGGEIRGQILPDGTSLLRADLAGYQEVPGVDTDATGVAFVTLNEGASTASIHATTAGLDDASDAHLHNGIGGVSGPVEIALTQDGSDPAHWFVDDAALSADQLAAILAGNTYVNVHSPAHPGGEIRGQVVPEGILFASGWLEGRQEVPGVDTEAGGAFAVTLDVAAMTLTTHATTTGAEDATAAHLHEALAGMSGGVSVPLAQDGSNAAHWSVVDAPVSADQLEAFSEGRLYVNVHTPAHPGGAIRGQAAPRGVEVLFNYLAGDQVVPAVTTTAGGLVATTMELPDGDLYVVANTTDADDATSAAVYAGAAGENGDSLFPLAQSPSIPSQWSAVTELDESDLDDYLDGLLYVQVATPANPDGELRAQIDATDAPQAPADVVAPTVTLTGPSGTVSGSVEVSADASDDEGVVEVRFLADGAPIGTDTSEPYTVDWDTTGLANGDVTLTAEAEDAAGNVGTSAEVVVTIDNAASTVSFADLQSQIFGVTCAGCHTGPTGSVLPAGMNLSSASSSYAALVGVPSIQQSALDRVEPNNPDDSYLVRKLEGGPGIDGSRMPQGGPFLSQAMIDMIRQWIAEGAQNN